MAKKISKEDIIEGSLLDDAIKQADLFLNKARELEGQLKSTLEVQRDFISNNKVDTSKELLANAKAVNQVTTNLKNLEQLEQQRIRTEQVKQKLLIVTEKLTRQKIKNENLEARNASNLAKQQLTLNSVYEQTKRKHNELSKAQMELSARGRENGVVFKAVKAEVDALRATLDRAEQGAGRFQRNVGNYASTFNGLGNSVNQLTRELPAFAVSMNTGFLAISNNLPIFFDAIERTKKVNAELKNSGQETQSVLKQLGSAVFSLGSLLSVGVTLLTIYGGKLIEVVGSLFEQNNALRLNKEAFEAQQEAIRNSIQAQKDLIKANAETNIDLLKDSGDLTDTQAKNLRALDKFEDSRLKILETRRKAAESIVFNQFKDELEDLEKKGATELQKLEFLKNEKLVILNEEGTDIIATRTAFGKESLSREEKAVRDALKLTNKEYTEQLRLLEIHYKDEIKLIGKEGAKNSNFKAKLLEEELVKQRSVMEQIRKMQIESITDVKERETELAVFQTQLAFDEIERNNETEREKLRIAEFNYKQRRAVEIANVKDKKQLIENLKDIDSNYDKELIRIKADNIPEEEQYALRIALAEKLSLDLLDIEKKFAKERDENIRKDFEATIEARKKILEDNNAFEIFKMQNEYNEKRSKQKAFDAFELNELNKQILEKRIAQIKADAEEKAALTDHEREKAAIRNAANIEIEKLQEQNKKDEKVNFEDDIKTAANFSNKLIDIYAREQQERQRILQENYNKEISEKEKSIDIQRRLAENGRANTLAFEEADKARMEREREDEKRKEIRRQKALAFFRAYASYVEKDPNTALTKAIRDSVIAETIAGSFIEGTENVERDLKGNKVHNGQDGYVIAVDGKERILNPEQNKMIGNMSNDELASLAASYNNGMLPSELMRIGASANTFADNVADSVMIHQLYSVTKELKEIKEVIYNKPETSFEFDKYGDFIKTTIEKGFEKREKYKTPKPRI